MAEIPLDVLRVDPEVDEELLRLWVTEDGYVVTTTRGDVVEDAATWGRILADFARRVAKQYAEDGEGDEDEVLGALREAFEEEMESPTHAFDEEEDDA